MLFVQQDDNLVGSDDLIYTGGQLSSAIAATRFNVFSSFFLKMYLLFIGPDQIKMGSKNVFFLQKEAVIFGEGSHLVGELCWDYIIKF